MNTQLMERPVAAPSVTGEQLELVKKTVAAGATADELKLYLYDCARQGVHPLDKLIHFTKRAGKYTPITSIDFMRIRAAETGEYAGSDDATFQTEGVVEVRTLVSATVTVWRLVQGTRCSFSATARWTEYKPSENDFMWKKMPHTMLGKCAEALALRKGFPKQLAGLYAKEEMDQAGPSQPTANVVSVTASEPVNTTTGEVLPAAVDLPRGTLLIIGVTSSPTRKANITKFTLELSDGRKVGTIKEQVGKLAEQACQFNAPVYVETKPTQWGEDVLTLTLHKPIVPPTTSTEPPLAVYDDGPF